MTTLKPKTIQQVLAEQTKAVSPNVAPTSIDTKAANQAQLEANKAKAAQREANKAPNTGVVSHTIDLPEPVYYETSTAELWPDWKMVVKWKSASYTDGVTTRYWQDAANAIASVVSKDGRNTSAPVKNPVVAPTPKISTINPKVQVWKLVSDFNNALTKSKGNKDSYYSWINYTSLSDKEKNVADRLFDTQTKKKWMVEPEKDIYDTYAESLESGIDATKAQYEADRKAQLEAEAAAKAEYDQFTTDTTNEIDSAFNTFQSEQNELLKNYESNRLNQVQGDLRRALLARGVDISKVPPEQLIALSGSVGAQAFSDISGAKERATTAIENARQNRLAKVQQLRQNKMLNDSQYNRQVATINSTANQAKNNLDLKFAETVFWIKTAQETKKETTETNTAQAIMNTAQSLGVTGSQFGVVNKFLKSAKSTPEAIQAMFAELQNPNSELYTILQSNESAAAKQQAFKNQIDLLEAQAKLRSASRSGGTGTIQNAYSQDNQ